MRPSTYQGNKQRQFLFGTSINNCSKREKKKELSRETPLGEDVVGLLLHQHGHVLDIATPEVQTLLHALNLKWRAKT